MKMGLLRGKLFTLRSKCYVYVVVVKIRQFFQLLFTDIFFIPTNQQLSSAPVQKATQALDANTGGVVSERSAAILHNFVVPAALRQAAASSNLCSITDL